LTCVRRKLVGQTSEDHLKYKSLSYGCVKRLTHHCNAMMKVGVHNGQLARHSRWTLSTTLISLTISPDAETLPTIDSNISMSNEFPNISPSECTSSPVPSTSKTDNHLSLTQFLNQYDALSRELRECGASSTMSVKQEILDNMRKAVAHKCRVPTTSTSYKRQAPEEWNVKEDLHIARLPALRKPIKKAPKQPQYTNTQPFDMDWIRNHTCVDCGDICEPAKVDLVRRCTNCDLPAHREHDSFTPDQRYVCPECMEAMVSINIDPMSLE